MRILIVSDQASYENCNPENVDLVLSCGDLPYFKLNQIKLRPNLRDVPLFGVYGNHDTDALEYIEGAVNLHLKTKEYKGILFGGCEGSIKYKDKPHTYTFREVDEFMRDFPYVDVFVAHSPIAGIFDADDGVHNGFPAFRRYVEEKKPKFFIHGHSHMRGKKRFCETEVISVFGWEVIEL